MTAALTLWGKTRRPALGALRSPISPSSARRCSRSPWTFQRRIKFKEIKSSRCQSQGESSSAPRGLPSKSWIICFELLRRYQTGCGGVFEEEPDLFVQKHRRGYSGPEAPWEKSEGWQAEAAGDGFDWQISAIFGIVFTFVWRQRAASFDRLAPRSACEVSGKFTSSATQQTGRPCSGCTDGPSVFMTSCTFSLS